MIGINTHLNYAAYQDTPRVAALIKSLGVTIVRDGLHAWGNNDWLSALYGALDTLGTDFTFVVDPNENLGELTPTMFDTYEWLADRRIKYFEGPNEVDRWAGDWVSQARAFQAMVAQAARTMAPTLPIQVIAPSLALTSNASQLGDLTSLCDLGNLHAYPEGEPENFLAPLLGQVAAVSGPKPVVVTECGYSTALISEADQATLLVRMILSYLKAEAKDIYLYELLDQEPAGTVTDPQLHFGLVRSDGTLKPAFNAVKNLLALLRSASGIVPVYTPPSNVYQYLRGNLRFLWTDTAVTLTPPAPKQVYYPALQAEPIIWTGVIGPEPIALAY